MYDVVVVGGGPAGCYAASLLAQKGYEVHVLEEHTAIGEPVDCSGVVGAESFASLDLPSSLVLGKVKGLTLVSPSQLKIRFSPSSPLAYVVDRSAFDRVIAEKAAQSGATLHLSARVVDLHVRDDGVELEVIRQTSNVKRQSGEEGTNCELRFANNEAGGVAIDELRLTYNPVRLMARVVILAGGPRYRIQGKLGMGKPGDFLRTAQTEIPVDDGIEEAKVFLGSGIAPGSFAWIAPFKREERTFARVGVSAKAAAAPYLRGLLKRLHAEGYWSNSEAPIRSWVIPISPLHRTYADRVLAVGDAAGQTKPTTGGGIYYGLLGAEAAAETVARAFAKGHFTAETLGEYEKAWRKKLGMEVRIGAFFRRLAERLTDEEIDELFRITQSDGVLTGVAQIGRFDWHRDVIYFALRHPQLGRIFLRGLFR